MPEFTDEQLRQFHDEGYVMVPGIYEPADIQSVRDELTAVIHECALQLIADGQLSRSYEEEPFERRLTRIFRETPEIMRAVTGRGGGGHSGPAFFDFIRHPRILAMIEALVGEEIVGSSVYRIRPKLPDYERGDVPWHQDSGYFSPHCDDQLIVTCWIPLVDATPENGCLRVLPGCHRRGVLRHFRDGPGGFLTIDDPDLPTVEPITVPVPLGGVLFMTNLTPHSSTHHTVDIVRWTTDVRYQSARLPNNIGELPGDFDPGRPEAEIACYPPEADFILRSPSRPETVVSEWEEFTQIRQRYEDQRPPGPDRGWLSLRNQDG